MSKFLASLILAFLLPLFAYATKERGGGNVDSKGRLAEVSSAADSEVLTPHELRILLVPTVAKLGGELPGLFEDLLFMNDDRTSWYLNSALNVTGCEFKSLVAINASPVACQDYDSEGVTEVRILKSFWSTASDEQKADLILHERIRTLLYKNRVSNCEHCLFRSVLALKAQPSPAYILNVQRALQMNRVGTYLLQAEKIEVMQQVRATMETACGLESEKSYKTFLRGELRILVDPSVLARATRFVLWMNTSNNVSNCGQIDAATESTLNFWRGEEILL